MDITADAALAFSNEGVFMRRSELQKISVISAAISLIFSQSAIAAVDTNSKPDSEVYVGGKLPPAKVRGQSRTLSFDQGDTRAGIKSNFFQRDIARWLDPLTPPHTRSTCVQEAHGDWPWGGLGVRCTGWKTEAQWFYNTATMTVQTADDRDIQIAVEQCLVTGAVAAAAAAIATGGAAADEAFDITMKACLVSKVGDSVTVSLDTHGGWGDWE